MMLEVEALVNMNCFPLKSSGCDPRMGCQETTHQIVFGVKFDLQRKAHLVVGGQLVGVIDALLAEPEFGKY
eukprot:9025678-Ditylum_brightwellii.AAC.2